MLGVLSFLKNNTIPTIIFIIGDNKLVGLHTIIFLIFDLLITGSNSGKNLSKTTIVSACESVRTFIISLLLYKGLIFTAMPPALNIPKIVTGNVNKFGSIIATLEDFCICNSL